MCKKRIILGSMLAACLLLAAIPSQAGQLWTFQNEGSIDQFTTGTVNGTVTWDNTGKLDVTGDGSSQLTFFGETWDPVSGYTDGNNSDSPVYPPAEPNRLLTFRMQATGGAATGQHLVVIYFDDTTGSYHGTDTFYRTGDQVIQLDLGAPGFGGGDWDLATSVITKVGIYLTYDEAVQQTVTFDWIALGDEAFTADVDPVWREDFATDLDGTVPGTNGGFGVMDFSWTDDGDGDGRLHGTYVENDPLDPFVFMNWGGYAGSDRRYMFCDLTAGLNPNNTPPLDYAQIGQFLSTDSLNGELVLQTFTYHNGRQIVAVDPVYAAAAILPAGGGTVYGDPYWLDINTPWTMIQIPDKRLELDGDPPGFTGTWDASMFTDFDWWAQGSSCRFILVEEFSALDSDEDGISDLIEVLDFGSDPDDANDPGASIAITASLEWPNIVEGNDLTLTAPVGSDHQWSKDGVPLADDDPRLTGTASRNLVFAPVLVSDSGRYKCQFNDGTKAVTVSENYFLDVGAELPVTGLIGLGVCANLLMLAGAAALRRRK